MPIPRLIFVTGKGGTGKSTIASAIATINAESGRKVLLLDVQERSSLHDIFGIEFQVGRKIQVGELPLDLLSIDADESFLDYLDKFYNLRIAGSLLKTLGAMEFATTTAPGLSDILLVGYAANAARSNAYDLVIVDAVPTGRFEKFITTADALMNMAKTGPIFDQALLVKNEIEAQTTAVIGVTTTDDLALIEISQMIEYVRRKNIKLMMSVLNQSVHADFSLDENNLGELNEKETRALLDTATLLTKKSTRTDRAREELQQLAPLAVIEDFPVVDLKTLSHIGKQIIKVWKNND
ncbi:MAG: ArsA family ATPase [Candidatus Nanopelagicales bacterium]